MVFVEQPPPTPGLLKIVEEVDACLTFTFEFYTYIMEERVNKVVFTSEWTPVLKKDHLFCCARYKFARLKLSFTVFKATSGKSLQTLSDTFCIN